MQVKLLYQEAEEMSWLSSLYKGPQIKIGNPFSVNSNYTSTKAIRKGNSEGNKDTDQAAEEAELLIKEAQLEYDRIMTNARVESAELREQSTQLGFADGMDMAKEQYESLIQEAEGMLADARKTHELTIKGLEHEVIQLVILAVKKIISEEYEVNKEIVLQLIRNVEQNCSNKEKLTVRVSEEDYEILMQNRDKLESVLDQTKEIEIKKVASMQPGDLEIDTPFGSINAGLRHQIDKLEEMFTQILFGEGS